METQAHRKRVRTYNVPGHLHFLTFSCYRRMPLLSNETWLGWLGAAVRTACQDFDFALWAYVFMPEHVHLLVKPRKVLYDVSKFRKSLKQSASKRIVNHLQKCRSALLGRLRVQERPGKECFRFWQEGPGHDKNLWSMEKAVEKAKYCHRNPVERKLVASPEQWRWSSFRRLELGQKTNQPLLLDDWDERLSEDEDKRPLAEYGLSQWHQFCEGTSQP